MKFAGAWGICSGTPFPVMGSRSGIAPCTHTDLVLTLDRFGGEGKLEEISGRNV